MQLATKGESVDEKNSPTTHSYRINGNAGARCVKKVSIKWGISAGLG